MRLVVATRNRGKVAELARLFAELPGVELVGMDELGPLPDVVEDGDTFEANAILKARAVASLSGLPALADDSGLEVDALGGAPGVHSARFAGRHGDDAANNARLLELLRDVPDERRTARFRCALALAGPRGTLHVEHGVVEGRISTEPRGGGGFGYDPLFLLSGDVRTTAELSLEEKNAVSHRAQAARRMRAYLARGGPIE